MAKNKMIFTVITYVLSHSLTNCCAVFWHLISFQTLDLWFKLDFLDCIFIALPLHFFLFLSQGCIQSECPLRMSSSLLFPAPESLNGYELQQGASAVSEWCGETWGTPDRQTCRDCGEEQVGVVKAGDNRCLEKNLGCFHSEHGYLHDKGVLNISIFHA